MNDNIVTDFMKALLGNGSVNTFPPLALNNRTSIAGQLAVPVAMKRVVNTFLFKQA
jgi:hypothetical protein